MARKSGFGHKSLSVLVAAVLLGGCAGTPPRSLAEIDRLQGELTRLRNDPQLGPLAPPELHDAQLALDLLAADGRVMSREAYDHSVYLAERLVSIAQAEARARFAERRAMTLDQQRERLLADSRRALLDAERAASARARADADAAQQAAAAAALLLCVVGAAIASTGDDEHERLASEATASLNTVAKQVAQPSAPALVATARQSAVRSVTIALGAQAARARQTRTARARVTGRSLLRGPSPVHR